MSALSGPLILLAARARRRPARWLLPAVGIGLATAFAGAVAAEGTIAGDQAARSALEALSPLDRTVRVTWQGPVTPSVRHDARGLLRALGLGTQTEVVLLNPVRVGGVIVRPAAISPLPAWVSSGRPARCGQAACPMLLAGSTVRAAALTAPGVRIPIVGRTRLRSAVPLGFTPGQPSDQPPLLLSGDVAGLEALAGLGGVYRAHSWLSVMPIAGLHSWRLAAVEARLQRAQADLLASGNQFTLSAPFAGLDAARAQAKAAPHRLLLAGGGALAALALFIVLAAGGLRRDQRADLARLQTAGARLGQCLLFVVGECAWVCGLAVLIGAGLAIAAAAVIAHAEGIPVGGVLAHSLITPTAAVALVGGLICATALVALTLLEPGPRLADVMAVAAAAALGLALTRGRTEDGALIVLLAPLCCLVAGVLVFRGAAALLRAAERIARRGPVLTRLALVGLARAPGAPSLAIAFIAVSIGLGGFALAYRATLLRGTADQAADRVPLDATVSPGPDFTTPLELAPLRRWSSIAGGTVLPVRRADASFVSGGGTVTVPALGVPASGLARLRGWRASDGSAPLPELARRLTPPGPVRVPGPLLAPGARWLSLPASSPALAVSVSADLRDSSGAVEQLALGDTRAGPSTLRARLPAGAWELEALELDEPTGLETTNGHQNAENPAVATQFTATVSLGPMRVLAGSGRALANLQLGRWRGVGAASVARAGRGIAVVRFTTSGTPGVLRPLQPSDLRAVPVLVDPQTTAAATRGGLLALTVDEQPVRARVVGVLARFPTLPADAAGFVVADQATLASALDAQMPGQGRADELWVSTSRPDRLHAALQTGAFPQLSSAFRTDIERALRAEPIARGVLGTLVGAAVLSITLAVLGLLVALLGAARDERVESDLVAQGIGPRGLRRELRLRLLLAGLIGVCVGVGIGLLLTRLAVASVRAAGAVATPRPPLVTVAPLGALTLWAAAAVAALAVASALATRALVGRKTAL